jgi:hypothetical protein
MFVFLAQAFGDLTDHFLVLLFQSNAIRAARSVVLCSGGLERPYKRRKNSVVVLMCLMTNGGCSDVSDDMLIWCFDVMLDISMVHVELFFSQNYFVFISAKIIWVVSFE